MIKIEKKIIKNKAFFYLSEQINIGSAYKKNQVYLGKNIPKNLKPYYDQLQEKEVIVISDNISKIFKLDEIFSLKEYIEIEKTRIKLKYLFQGLTKYQKEILWKKFAIRFIFESNAIEGSKLSEKEVIAIVRKKFGDQNERKEIIEVHNAIKAFEIIKSGLFALNQRKIIALHNTLTQGLDITRGYKKKHIVVNNKETVSPGKVRDNMATLINWWHEQKKAKLHPFILTASFHSRFEHIHPFADGNGRVGRLIYIWMLQKFGYGVILFENKNRQSYFTALDQADNGRPRKLYYHCLRAYRRTASYLSPES